VVTRTITVDSEVTGSSRSERGVGVLVADDPYIAAVGEAAPLSTSSETARQALGYPSGS